MSFFRKELYDLFNQFELGDLPFLNEADRHYDLSDLDEESLAARVTQRPGSVEGEAIRRV